VPWSVVPKLCTSDRSISWQIEVSRRLHGAGCARPLNVPMNRAGVNRRASVRPFAAVKNYLGRSQLATDAYYQGGLDEFRWYNRALSAAEVAGLFTAVHPTATDPSFGYAFDETSGDFAAGLTEGARSAHVAGGVSFGEGKAGSALQLDGNTGYVALADGALTGLSRQPVGARRAGW